MDGDLERMAREQLVAEARRLRQGIRAHRDPGGLGLYRHRPALPPRR